MEITVATLVVGSIAAFMAAVGVFLQVINLWRRRPRMKPRVQAATGHLEESKPAWFLCVNLHVDNQSDQPNAIQSVALRIGPPHGTVLPPVRIVRVDINGHVTLDLQEDGKANFSHHLINFEQPLKLPLRMQPHETHEGWFLFPLLPEFWGLQFELSIKSAKGPDRTIPFKMKKQGQ